MIILSCYHHHTLLYNHYHNTFVQIILVECYIERRQDILLEIMDVLRFMSLFFDLIYVNTAIGVWTSCTIVLWLKCSVYYVINMKNTILTLLINTMFVFYLEHNYSTPYSGSFSCLNAQQAHTVSCYGVSIEVYIYLQRK